MQQTFSTALENWFVLFWLHSMRYYLAVITQPLSASFPCGSYLRSSVIYSSLLSDNIMSPINLLSPIMVASKSTYPKFLGILKRVSAAGAKRPDCESPSLWEYPRGGDLLRSLCSLRLSVSLSLTHTSASRLIISGCSELCWEDEKGGLFLGAQASCYSTRLSQSGCLVTSGRREEGMPAPRPAGWPMTLQCQESLFMQPSHPVIQ